MSTSGTSAGRGAVLPHICPTRLVARRRNCTKPLVRGMFLRVPWEVQLLSRAPNDRPLTWDLAPGGGLFRVCATSAQRFPGGVRVLRSDQVCAEATTPHLGFGGWLSLPWLPGAAAATLLSPAVSDCV